MLIPSVFAPHCKLIRSTRTRLQAPWECVDGIMLHCKHLRQYWALLIIDLVAGVSFSALGIIFTVLKVRVWRQTLKAMSTGRKETLANHITLREKKTNHWVKTADSKVDIKEKTGCCG